MGQLGQPNRALWYQCPRSETCRTRRQRGRKRIGEDGRFDLSHHTRRAGFVGTVRCAEVGFSEPRRHIESRPFGWAVADAVTRIVVRRAPFASLFRRDLRTHDGVFRFRDLQPGFPAERDRRKLREETTAGMADRDALSCCRDGGNGITIRVLLQN